MVKFLVVFVWGRHILASTSYHKFRWRHSSVPRQASLFDEYADSGTYFFPDLGFFSELLRLQQVVRILFATHFDSGAVDGVALGGKFIMTATMRQTSTRTFDGWGKVAPCLFLDRDRVLIEDTGYPFQPEEIRFF